MDKSKLDREKDMNEVNAEKFANMHMKNLRSYVYRHNQAIEYARQKLGMKWDDNRQRLAFYEYFDEYDKQHGGI